MRNVEVYLNSIYEIRKNKITNYNKYKKINNNYWLIYNNYTYRYAVCVLQALSTSARTELNLLNTQLNQNCKNRQISMQGYLNFCACCSIKREYFRK